MVRNYGYLKIEESPKSANLITAKKTKKKLRFDGEQKNEDSTDNMAKSSEEFLHKYDDYFS